MAGELYLAAVYGRALTAAEVDANFKSNFGRFGADADETRARILLQLSPTARREYQRLLTGSTQIESQIRLLTGGPAHLSVPKSLASFTFWRVATSARRESRLHPAGSRP